MEQKGYAKFGGGGGGGQGGGVKKVNKEVGQVAYNPSKQVKKFLFLLAMENCKWIKQESYF